MEEMVVLPQRIPEESIAPTNVNSNKAFYAAATSGGDVVQNYKDSKLALETTGASDFVTQAEARWKTEQDAGAKKTVVSIVVDPSIDSITKQSVLAEYARTGFVSSNLREKYKLQVASNPTGGSRSDDESQMIWAESMNERDKAAQQTQEEMDKFATSLDSNTGMALLGIVRDVLPGVALAWNASIAKTARETGVDKNNWDTVKSFLLSGSGNKAIKEAYDLLPIEKRKEFVTRLAESNKSNPSFDFNKWIDFQAQLESDHPGWSVGLDNTASVVNVLGLGWLLRAGKKALTYEGLVRPRVNPVSPAGTTATANLKAAEKLGAAAVADTTGDLAQAAGTTRGAIIADWLLPKLDAEIGTIYPNIARDLELTDKYMSGVFKETKFDPSLIDLPTKDKDIEYIGQVLREVRGPIYQQSNSVVEEEARVLKGTMTFGRNETFGFAKKAEAVAAEKQLQEAITNISGGQPGITSLFKHDKQWFLQWKFEKATDPFSDLTFSTDSVSAKMTLPWFNGKEFGFKMDALAKSPLGKHIFPNTMSMDTWVPKSAALADMRAAKIEHDFIRELKANVVANPYKNELKIALLGSEESGAWKTPAELSAMFPHINTQGQEELFRAYTFYRRVGDYEYQWANRWDKSQKAAKGYGAIYDRTGKLVGYGTEHFPKTETPAMVWDVATNTPVKYNKDLAGRKLVRLESAIDFNKNKYEFAIVDNLHPLPPNTLPKLDVYIPRRNIENWYVKSTPKQLNINGVNVEDKARLEQHQRVIGAGDTRSEAEALAERMRADRPDEIVEVRQERADTPDAILTDYRVYRQLSNYGKKRGEHLPTVDGSSRLEDPLVSMVKSIKTTVRLDAWNDYTDAFRTNWMKAFGEFTRGHEFPSVKTDLVAPKGATPEVLAKFRTAERLFEQYTNQAYKSTYGDELWKSFFFNLSNELEKFPVKLPHQLMKDMGKQGNLLVKAPKQLGTFLFINTNIPRQWLVQPQQIMELLIGAKTGQASYDVAGNAGQVVAALLAKSKSLSEYTDIAHAIARKASLFPPQEFDNVVEAIYKSGLPQSVDLNMMLHGTFNDVERAIVESSGRKFWEGTKIVATLPSKLGRAVGYSTAELTNQVALWIAARARWIESHPGVEWNTPNNIAQITGEAWDIGHSMSTRAGAFPYQDGAMSLPMQFIAVQHKAFMQMFSSKTLTVEERARFAAARVALYGMYGVPAGVAIDAFLQKYAGEETKTEWNNWKRGLADWVVNGMIRGLVDGPNEKSNISISHALSPLPETVPYYDLYRELVRYSEDRSGNLRLPFVTSMGSVYQGVVDIAKLFRSGVLDTPTALERAGRIAAETMSGYNNYAKAMMLKNFGDKMDKMGNWMGLGATHAEMVAQLFGITTDREVALYAATDQRKQRDQFIKQYAQDTHRQLMGMRKQFGQEDYTEYVSRMNAVTSLLDPDLRDEIRAETFKLDKQSLLTRNESILVYAIEHYRQQNDHFMSSMIAALTASDNPQAQRNLEVLKKEGIVNDK